MIIDSKEVFHWRSLTQAGILAMGYLSIQAGQALSPGWSTYMFAVGLGLAGLVLWCMGALDALFQEKPVTLWGDLLVNVGDMACAVGTALLFGLLNPGVGAYAYFASPSAILLAFVLMIWSLSVWLNVLKYKSKRQSATVHDLHNRAG